jgi:hypothetical protein
VKSALLGLVLIFASCSTHHASDQFSCTTSSDCASDRTCDNGFCVIKGTIDAPMQIVDAPRGDAANTCPAGCTSCNVTQKTCTIDCALTSCVQQIKCPTGYHCDIQCKGDGACRNGVDCQSAASCNVQCPGTSSCQDVQCGAGPCDVNCTGVSSCRTVTCGSSCACDVTCTGSMSCRNAAPVCTSPACMMGLGCTSVPLVCHSCM